MSVPHEPQFYLIRSLRNNLLKAVQKEAKQQKLANISLENLPQVDNENDNQFELEDRKLKKALEQLPERQKTAIYFKYYQNLSNKAIAEILGVEYQSISNLLQRAIKSLKSKV